MKTLLLFILLSSFLRLCFLPAFCDAAKMIPCQGYLQVEGVPLQGMQEIILRVYDGLEEGTLLYEELDVIPVYDGVYGTVLGDAESSAHRWEAVLIAPSAFLEIEAEGRVFPPRASLSEFLGNPPEAAKVESGNGTDVLVHDMEAILKGSSAISFAKAPEEESRQVSALPAGQSRAAGAVPPLLAGFVSRDAKQNKREVNRDAVLHRLAALPVNTWSYKNADESARHIGPDAEDFHLLFGVGEVQTHIAAVDADGVSFAAIQALLQELDVLKREQKKLEQRLQRMERR